MGRLLLETEGSVVGALDASVSLQSLVAKRHYHQTGALRWYEVAISSLASVEAAVAEVPRNGAIGRFVLAIPEQGESMASARELCLKASRAVAGPTTPSSVCRLARGVFPEEARELAALERVRDGSAQLHGDRVARTEVLARIAALRERIDSDVSQAFETATWYHNGTESEPLTRAALNGLASTLADRRYSKRPAA